MSADGDRRFAARDDRRGPPSLAAAAGPLLAMNYHALPPACRLDRPRDEAYPYLVMALSPDRAAHRRTRRGGHRKLEVA